MCKHVHIDFQLFIPEAVEVRSYIFRIDINEHESGCARRCILHPPELLIKTDDAEVRDIICEVGGVTIERRKRRSGVREELLVTGPAGGEDGYINCPQVVNE